MVVSSNNKCFGYDAHGSIIAVANVTPCLNAGNIVAHKNQVKVLAANLDSLN